ncbi:hypothetical protein CDD83_5160 [Cordyceps sp. RAO-2017]|nr:hypothetical protein CDD83_5160 [Cordyceps sp. RAO-2017]
MYLRYAAARPREAREAEKLPRRPRWRPSPSPSSSLSSSSFVVCRSSGPPPSGAGAAQLMGGAGAHPPTGSSIVFAAARHVYTYLPTRVDDGRCCTPAACPGKLLALGQASRYLPRLCAVARGQGTLRRPVLIM